MNIRPVLIAALASASLASPFVMAHTGGHDDDAKAIPKTCEQLADTKRYISDVAYPEVKKLKELFVYGVETSKILSRRGGGASLR